MISLERIADGVTDHAGVILALTVVLSAGFAGGMVHLETDSSLGQFEADTPERDAMIYASENFSQPEGADETAVLIAVESPDGEVVSRESMLTTLRVQQAIRENETVAETLSTDNPTVGIDTLVASLLIRGDEIAALEERAADLEERQAALERQNRTLGATLSTVRAYQAELDELEEAYEAGDIDAETYRNESDALETSIEANVTETTAELDPDQTERFERAVRTVRATQTELSRLDPDDFDTATAYETAKDRLEGDIRAAKRDGTIGVLAGEYDELRDDYETLRADRTALETAPQPPIDEQVEAVTAANATTIDRTVTDLFAESDGYAGTVAHQLLPADRDPDSADAALIVVNQELPPDADARGLDALDEKHVSGQLAVRSIVHNEFDQGDATVFGYGLLLDEIETALHDSLMIVGGAAFIVVLVLLGITLRDPVDVVLTLAGLALVLVWTLGLMGWAGIVLNQAVVAVPVLLIGISIDYAIHLLYRHREHRRLDGAAAASPRAGVRSIRGAVAGVGVALGLVTATTAIGFLSNVVSPVGPIREFGIVSAVGMVTALVVFGAVVPAAKSVLIRRWPGADRWSTAGPLRWKRPATLIAGASVRRPMAIVAVALLLTAGALAVAPTVDTTLDEEDFLADEPPEWVAEAGPFAMEQPRTAAAMRAIDDRFGLERPHAQIVVRGDVDDPAAMARLHDAAGVAAERDAVATAADGGPAIETPLTLMHETAADHESFAARFEVADPAGDGIPERNVGGLYEGLVTWSPVAADRVVHRTDGGDIEAVRLLIEFDSADQAVIVADVEAIAAAIEDDRTAGAGDVSLTATPTGDAIVTHRMERATLRAMGWSLAITVVVVLAILTVAYRGSGRDRTLGAVTVVPVLLTVAWVLGAMALLDIPLHFLTAIIASLTVGLGVAFSVHLSSRFRLERGRGHRVEEALTRTVGGTGGAILASAATTIAGVGTLLLATVPVLRHFGAVTVLMIAGTLLASVLVLPALLVLWSGERKE